MTEHKEVYSSGSFIIILIALSLAAAISVFLHICITALMPDIEISMNITATQASLLGTAVFLGYAIMQIPAGVLTDTLGGRVTLILFLGVAGVSTVAVAATNMLGVAVAGRFVTGMAVSFLPPVVALLAACVPPARFAFALGLLFASTAIGVVCGGTPLALLNQLVGWKVALFLSAGIAIGLMFVLAMLLEKPSPAAKAAQPAFSFPAMMSNILFVLRTKEFWPLALWQMFMAGTFFILAGTWWTKYLVGTAELTRLEAGHVYMAQALIMICVLPVCGYLSDRMRSRKKLIVLFSLVGVGVSVSYALLAGTLGLMGLIVQAILFAMGTSGAASCFMATIKETFPERFLGTATGCCNMLYPFYTAVVTPLFGVMVTYKSGLLEASGASAQAASLGAYSFASWLLVGGSVLGLLMAFLIKESYGKKAAEDA